MWYSILVGRTTEPSDGLKSLSQLKGSDKMKKALLIALAAVMVAAVFVGGYAVGKTAAESNPPTQWVDESGEIYTAK